MTTVVIRFSSVGDIVLCASVTQQLAPVVFITKPRYRQLAAALPDRCASADAADEVDSADAGGAEAARAAGGRPRRGGASSARSP